MDYWRITTWVLTFLLSPSPLLADSLQDAIAYCQSQQAGAATPCHLQPCPCNPGQETLKRFEEANGNPPLCACASSLARRHTLRQQAVEVCDEYRRDQRQPCFISRGDCPHGFEALADFSDDSGYRISACRDSRNEQPHLQIANLRGMSRDQLLAQYDLLVSHLESRLVGPPKPLPESTLDALNGYFPGYPLNRLSLMRTRALSQGCFSDCNRIFCADNGQIAMWTNPEHPRINRNLLHQIVHGDRCEQEGGRERFVAHWFEHLPDDVYQKLQANAPIDADRIHFAMYMESHADNRAESLCRRLHDCLMQ